MPREAGGFKSMAAIAKRKTAAGRRGVLLPAGGGLNPPPLSPRANPAGLTDRVSKPKAPPPGGGTIKVIWPNGSFSALPTTRWDRIRPGWRSAYRSWRNRRTHLFRPGIKMPPSYNGIHPLEPTSPLSTITSFLIDFQPRSSKRASISFCMDLLVMPALGKGLGALSQAVFF